MIQILPTAPKTVSPESVDISDVDSLHCERRYQWPLVNLFGK